MENKRLQELCRNYTNLTEEEIGELQKLNEFLPLVSKVTDGDVFIDCITRDPNTAVVVAEALRDFSSYKETVVGKLALRENEPAALRTLNTGVTTSQLYGISQENFPMEQNTVAIMHKEKIIGVLIIEKVAMEEFSRSKENSYGEGGDPPEKKEVSDLNLLFDNHGLLIDYNDAAEEFYRELGYHSSLMGLHFNNLTLEEIRWEEVMNKKYVQTKGLRFGSYVFDIQYIVLSAVKCVNVIIQDRTEIKNQEQELINKSIAIHEVHHRVKNNLQTIASLLRMQLRRSEDPKIQEVFQESINRILSIAVTYDILSKDPSGEVNINLMTRNLISSLESGGIAEGKKIATKVIGSDLVVNAQQAIFLALIINELVSNSYLHAFHGRDSGSIMIILEAGEFQNSIVVIDDGNGFQFENVRDDALGINIVKGLVQESLNGELHIDSSPKGTRVHVEFPL